MVEDTDGAVLLLIPASEVSQQIDSRSVLSNGTCSPEVDAGSGTGTAVINFESETLGVYKSLTIQGVTFTAVDAIPAGDNFSIDNTDTRPDGKYLDNGPSVFHRLDIDFLGAVPEFGFDYFFAQNWILEAFDADGNLVASTPLPTSEVSGSGFVGIQTTGIHSARFSTNVGLDDRFFIDDFTFTPAFDFVVRQVLPLGVLDPDLDGVFPPPLALEVQ